jgi:hypothetical protein
MRSIPFMNEILLDCPACGRKNFTKAGMRAHRCKGAGKALAVVPSFDVNIAHIRDYHRLAMNSAAQTTCAAAMVGLELQKVKVALKKSATGGTFDDWLEQHEEQIGFSRRTAFRYTALAENLKSKLLKSQDHSVVVLIGKAPSDLNDRQVKTLLLAMHKSVDGQSLSELYEDFGITRKAHGASLKDKGSSSGAGDAPPPVTTEEKIQMQLDLFGSYSLSLDETVMEHGAKILLITKWPKPRLDEAIRIAKRNLTLLVKVRGAVK